MLSYERDRVRFLLKAYLRARLEKVQRFAGGCRSGGRSCAHLQLTNSIRAEVNSGFYCLQ